MTVLAWDIGTSGVKAVVVGRDGRIVRSARRDYQLVTGEDGAVHQDLDEIERAIEAATLELFGAGGASAGDVEAIGLTAQMFDLAPVDAAGGQTIPMLSWLDQRAVREAEALAHRLDRRAQTRLFGSIITAKDVVPKIEWLRDRRPDAWDRTRWLLDCKEAIVLRLTGRAVIDPAGALAFRLYDPIERRWSAEACAAAGVPIERLPAVEPATAIAGQLQPSVARRLGLRSGIPVVVGTGDVPASQLGAGATDPGDAHVSLGTAVYFGVTVDQPVADPAGQLGVIGHADPRHWILWLEVATGGGALSWLLRALGDGSDPSAAELARLDAEVGAVVDEMDDLVFAPWLSGERVPVFDDRVRGAFVGLGLRHRRGHLLRALMEGVAYQMRWALEYGAAFGTPIGEVRGVGGGFIGAAWTQIIADVLDRPIASIRQPQDAAAVGAAACALVGIGAQRDLRFVRDIVAVERTFVPDPERRGRLDAGFERFRRLYAALAPLFIVDQPVAAPAEVDALPATIAPRSTLLPTATTALGPQPARTVAP
ncbi:MAG TPA: FGGY family carbohydrate kinase [Candidatus Limnocylindrales bacterium]|nr:FGGY family carbohydrate kinase [Candidatus Limnocylindrales bacterium]